MRYALAGSTLAAAVAGLAVAWSMAAEKTAPAVAPATALVVVYDQGRVVKTHRLTEAKQVAALAAHFPSYEKRPSKTTPLRVGKWGTRSTSIAPPVCRCV